MSSFLQSSAMEPQDDGVTESKLRKPGLDGRKPEAGRANGPEFSLPSSGPRQVSEREAFTHQAHTQSLHGCQAWESGPPSSG